MINKYKKIVIKIGSSSIVNPKSKKINTKWMIKLCKDIKKYHKEKNIIIVCSGAIALGSPLIKNKNLRKLEDKQAAASVGQIELAHQWKQHLKTHKIDIAQVLITIEDSEVRRRYLNARKTINTLLQNKVIPVINENDTVATEEIKYGDNDRLAARVAQMIDAELLILLSDVDGLYDKNTNKIKDAQDAQDAAKSAMDMETLLMPPPPPVIPTQEKSDSPPVIARKKQKPLLKKIQRGVSLPMMPKIEGGTNRKKHYTLKKKRNVSCTKTKYSKKNK